jgi:acyl carrier protein
MWFAGMFHQLHWNMQAMLEAIQRLIDEKGGLSIAARDLTRDADLYRAGLTPFSAIQVMISLEKEFNIEFPDWMLNRQSMSSINAIISCLCELEEHRREAPARAA